jgi:hypothetical protein
MAYVANGTTVEVGTTTNTSAPGTYASVIEVTDISISGITGATIDTTSLTDTARKAVIGQVDNGTVSLSIFLPPSDNALLGYLKPAGFVNGTYRNFKITFGGSTSTGSEMKFDGFVTSLNVSAGIDAAVTADLTIRIKGALTWTG